MEAYARICRRNIYRNIDEYVVAVEKLAVNSRLKNELSSNAKEFSRGEYSLKKLNHEWNKLYEDLLLKRKTHKSWEGESLEQMRPCDVFVESLGRYSGPFKSYLDANTQEDKEIFSDQIKALATKEHWRSRSKSTVHQYRDFFANDEILQLWSGWMGV